MKTPSEATVQPSAEPNSRSNTKAVLAFRVAPTNSVNAAPQVVASPSVASKIAASSAIIRHGAAAAEYGSALVPRPALRVSRQEVGGIRDMVGDARQPRIEHVKQSTDARQQKYRR
jgi:hypothetical protein